MRRNMLSLLVAFQSIVIALWLIVHRGKMNYTNSVRGFQHTGFLNSWVFYSMVLITGFLLIYSILKKRVNIQKWSLILMNAMWSAYTVVLFINELNGVPNMSWALLLGYNVAIYLAARYEVSG